MKICEANQPHFFTISVVFYGADEFDYKGYRHYRHHRFDVATEFFSVPFILIYMVNCWFTGMV